MSFTPPYRLLSIEKLPFNVAAVIERDQALALEWAAPGAAPGMFKYFGISRRVDQQVFPSCLVLSNRIAMNQNAEAAGMEMRQELIIEIANHNPDPEKLASEMLTRSRAVTNILLGAAPADLFEGVTISSMANAYGGLAWDIQEVAPNQFPRQNAHGHYLSVLRLSTVFTYLEM